MFAPLAVLLATVSPLEEVKEEAPPGSAAFAAELYRAVAAQKAGESLILSPESVRVALAMAQAGAAGETAGQIAAVLRLPRADDGTVNHAAVGGALRGLSSAENDVTVSPANRVWTDAAVTLAPAYARTLRVGYGAPPATAPFQQNPEAVRRTINAWVSEATAGKIAELLAPGALQDDSRLALVNALYVKAPWADDFSERATRPAPFARDDGTTAEVPLMSRHDDMGLHLEPDGTAAVRIYYRGGRLAFTAVLPPDGTPLAEFDETLTGARLARLLGGGEWRDVKLFLPRFRVETTAGLAEVVAALGVRRAFTDEAEFLAMQAPPAPGASPRPLKIGTVAHAAVIEVDEEGTEAAAATAVGIEMSEAFGEPPPKPYVFRADRPFLFALTDVRSGAVLFLGRYAGP